MKHEVVLGKLIEGEQQRDAIHIAVAPVTASVKLAPGQDVGLLPDGTAGHVPNGNIGIVDPFLRAMVFPGQQFFMFLYPNLSLVEAIRKALV